jgi:hypothetical protein
MKMTARHTSACQHVGMFTVHELASAGL